MVQSGTPDSVEDDCEVEEVEDDCEVDEVDELSVLEGS